MKLELKDITKNYGKKKALDHFSASFSEGIYGILGPNGAGKSTMMNLLCCLLRPDEGEILFEGKDIHSEKKEYLRHIGCMPQVQTLYPEFTVREFLLYMATLREMDRRKASERIDELLSTLSLKDAEHKRIKTCSGGMKQRVLLAQALLDDPDIILLDEPTAGLDPKQRIAVRNLIASLAVNKIILIATHIVPDIEMIASECLLMNHGNLIRRGTQDHLCRELEGEVFLVKTPPDQIREISRYGLISGMSLYDGIVSSRLIAKQKPPFESEMIRASMEDVYLYWFGEDAV